MLAACAGRERGQPAQDRDSIRPRMHIYEGPARTTTDARLRSYTRGCDGGVR